MSGRIVILNGVPRAGKSAIARELQARGPWLAIGVDSMAGTLPDALKPGIGLRPGGERPDLEPMVLALYGALFDTIAAHSRAGFDIVADLAIHDAYSRPLGIWPLGRQRLAGLPVLTVMVACADAEIIARRAASQPTGFYSTDPEIVARWRIAVQDGVEHDLALDTTTTAAAGSADAILSALAART